MNQLRHLGARIVRQTCCAKRLRIRLESLECDVGCSAHSLVRVTVRFMEPIQCYPCHDILGVYALPSGLRFIPISSRLLYCCAAIGRFKGKTEAHRPRPPEIILVKRVSEMNKASVRQKSAVTLHRFFFTRKPQRRSEGRSENPLKRWRLREEATINNNERGKKMLRNR